MTDVTIIKVIPKNARESVRIAIDQYQGIDLVDVRVQTNDDEPQLTKKGIAIRPDKLRALIDALTDAEAECQRRGLIGRRAA